MGDDAEKAIAGLLAEHRWPIGKPCTCGYGIYRYEDYEAHVASVIAAHMAAPDELTAHENRVSQETLDAGHELFVKSLRDELRSVEAERDALRERIRALAETWEVAPISNLEELRALGDA